MITPNSKIIFFGTPQISADVLKHLIDAGYEISLVVTNPDKPIGRNHIITPTPVKVLALANDIPFLSPERFDTESLEKIKSLKTNMGIVVAYGHIIPQVIIDAFPKGLLNIHYSLLPKYRGASPVENAILAGDNTTGVTIQKLAFKLDAGPIVSVKAVSIDDKITSPELKKYLTDIGSKLLIETIPAYLNDEIKLVEQVEDLATHCKKISKADGEIKLSDGDMEKWLKYRAYFGWPGIFYFDENGKRINPHTNFSQEPQKENDLSETQTNSVEEKINKKVGVRVKITEATFEDSKFIIKKIIPEGKKEISL